MKKYKFLTIILSLFLCFSLFALTACSTGNLEDPDLGGDSVEDGGGSSSGGDDGGDEPEPEPEPDVATSDYFDGVVILFRPDPNSAEDRFTDGVTGTQMTFNQLLDRQISMLADDILNRLAGVYGTGYGSIEKVTELKDKDGISPEYQSIPASYVAKNAFATYDEVEGGYLYSDGSVADGSYFDLTQIASWANAVYTENGTLTNSINSTEIFKYNFGLINAINGFSMKTKTRTDEETPKWSFRGFNDNSDVAIEYQWNWNTNSDTINHPDTNSLFMNYRDNLRLALSSLLLTGEYDADNSYDFDQTTYDNNLSNIGHIGLLSYDKQVIKNFIKDVIIGKDLIDADNEALRLLNENFDLTNFTGIEPDAETLLTMTESERDVLDTMHTYKAYDLIVDAIVEQAASNTFDGVAPIYAEMPRLSSMYMSWEQIDAEAEATGTEFKTSTSLRINSIIILPKDIVRLNLALCFFEALTGDKDFYAKVNINFVADDNSYTTSKNTPVKIGEQEVGDYEEGTGGNSSGPNIPELSSSDNTFLIEASDFGEKEDNPFYVGESEDGSTDLPFDPPEGMGDGGIYEFPIWSPHNLPIDDITTFNNPYTMEQSNSVSATVYFDGGSNYMELSFEFFEDEGCTTPCVGIPEYSFGLIDFDFEWENL